MKWRIGLLVFLFGSLYAVLTFNLYNLQIKHGLIFATQAADQNRQSGLSIPNRGNIYFVDKDNRQIPAVLNKEFSIIYAVPTEIADSLETASQISAIVGQSVNALKEALSKPKSQYELLVYKASDDQIKQIQDLKVKGIYITKELLRFYPLGERASQVLGFVGPNQNDDGITGRYGIEAYFNDLLGGQTGQIQGDFIIKPKNGDDLVLTIDPNIQLEAEDILKNLVEEYKASAGMVIVEEPKTGKILAMNSVPSFDPNNYSNYSLSSFLNPVVQAVYEPGSVFKVLTMSAGIDSGKITPQTTYVDKGSVTYNGKTIQNFELKTYGKQTMTNVIENSINTGAVFAERQTGHETFYNYLKNFGLNVATGITLPGELKGNLSNLVNGKDINYATASFGQGVAVTPIEVINAIAAIANKGKLMKPYIVASEKPTVIRQVISENTANQVVQMMVSAVKVNKVADIKNYSVAAKTGTAFVPNFKTGGYTEDVINTYIGFAPAYDPRFIILFRIDKPAGAISAGRSVVPAFKKLAEFLLNYYNVAPDQLDNANH
ncbi:MAG: penicillin-binding protein 2 [Candidatus Paceibacterota bacterium]|jgi:cell division protein FtsI/penicillin-binding protein 2